MKILLVHNSYQQPGGEDRVYALERQLLESQGHEVITYHRTNSELNGYSALQRLLAAPKVVWAKDTHQQLSQLLQREKPQLVHVHNTFLQISASIFDACREEGVPVVQTLHNFRLMCPAANFFRDGKICEDCREYSLWRSVRHACYRDSSVATALVAIMLVANRRHGIWNNSVANFIALTEFSRKKFAEGGLPVEKIVVKPNFVSPDPGEKDEIGEGAVYVGRLSPEKGLVTLLQAWRRLRSPVPLWIVGDGPLRGKLEQMALELNLPQVTFMGRVSPKEAQSAIKCAQVLILPSQCYENFPLTIIEALACGTPVICSRLGAMQEIVTDRETGLHFTAGDPEDLAEKVEWTWSHPRETRDMGKAARRAYERRYTAPINYASLMDIYRRAMSASS